MYVVYDIFNLCVALQNESFVQESRPFYGGIIGTDVMFIRSIILNLADVKKAEKELLNEIWNVMMG